jgi:hypothetical protein
MDNPFVLNKSDYTRELNLMGTYVTDQASYLNLMTGRPLDECKEFVLNSIGPGGQFEFKDPPVKYLERQDNGDRQRKVGTLRSYLASSIKNRELIAPTLTTYCHPSVRQSLLVDFIDGNVAARSVAKKAMFKAKVEGNKPLETIKKIEQTNKKLSNNSVSGAHVSASTPLFNRTAHSTLTSNCRSTSAYGNANNEKFLCGNRHYWSSDIVRNNIISIINHTDYYMLELAMNKFGIRHPTVDETMDCITYSTQLYLINKTQIQRLRLLVCRLSDLQRSAFVYTGDLYHLRKYNEDVVRQFLAKLSKRVAVEHPDPASVLDTAPEDYVHLAAQICTDEMRGKNMKMIKGTPAEGIMASTVQNVLEVIQEYRDMIRALWVTPNVPASVAHFPDSIRHAAITSDTDSTIFTVQEWVQWYRNAMVFDNDAKALAASMIFLAAQGITHILARMSANFGIEEKRIHQIAMKNEFKFDVFTPTQVAKHYFALIGCQEGNVFEEYDKEIKGVHLKSSNAPKAVMKSAREMMEFIMNSIIDGKKISMAYLLKWVGDIERDVQNSIKKGSYEYFKMGQIKTSDSYTKEPQDSPYNNYLLWQEVFAEKYGNCPPPPYTCVKISTQLHTPTKTKDWLAKMEDRALAARMEAWMMKYKKKIGTLGTIQLPEQAISSAGIPQEILDVVGVRQIVLDTTKVFYIILESLGVYILNDRTTRLISDQH